MLYPTFPLHINKVPLFHFPYFSLQSAFVLLHFSLQTLLPLLAFWILDSVIIPGYILKSEDPELDNT